VPISLFGYLPVFSYCEMANGRTCLLPLGFALDFFLVNKFMDLYCF